MADNTLLRVCTLGVSMLFERQEPNLEAAMTYCSVGLKNVGVTESGVRKLVNKIMGMDFVAVPDGWLDKTLSHTESHGYFNVVIERQAIASFIETIEEESIVSHVTHYSFCEVTKSQLKDEFPEYFADRYFCEECDDEKENEKDPCSNGSCIMGVMNFRSIQEANEKLAATVSMLEADSSIISGATAVPVILDEVEEEEQPEYHCPSCEAGPFDSDDIDDDDDIFCENCDRYFYVGD